MTYNIKYHQKAYIISCSLNSIEIIEGLEAELTMSIEI